MQNLTDCTDFDKIQISLEEIINFNNYKEIMMVFKN